MFRCTVLTLTILLHITTFSQQKLVSFVDPFIGTGAHGHTFPGAVVPFGMVQLSPDTDTRGWDWCSGYHASDSSIIGFSHTHLSGTGAADLGDILVTAVTGPAQFSAGSKESPLTGYRAVFDKYSEKAEPGYYSVFLKEYGILAEMTATERTGFHRYTFPSAEEAYIIVDLEHGISDRTTQSYIKVVSPTKIEGLRRSNGWANDQFVYFVLEFSRPFISSLMVRGTMPFLNNNFAESEQGVKGFFKFKTKKDETILVKVSLSSVDVAGAEKNLTAENSGWDFEKIRASASALWEKELSKIIVEGNNKNDKIKFYTALYHAFLAPYLYSDVDGRYRGMDGKIHTAKDFRMYNVFSLWDTYRAAHPLYSLLDAERTKDFMRSLLAKYEEFGVLPVWELASNETGCMIGYHSVPVLADAIMKGIKGFDYEKAYEAMKRSAMQDTLGIEFVKKMCYIPRDRSTDVVSRTLEYAYDDWCIAQCAKLLGKQEDYKYFITRASYYQNVFDPETKMMRGRYFDGRWKENFDPTEPSGLGVTDFTEGNSWQYTWYVPQDVEGLIALMGGENAFITKLDSLFIVKQNEKFHTPADVTGLIGQYAHGNEPSHHISYLYNYAGVPEKTQRLTRRIMNELYLTGREGLCGNEDCGQMSAWFVFSSLGFYPVTPASGINAIGSPIFNKAVLTLSSGKSLTINYINNSDKNIYVTKTFIKGKESYRSYLTDNEILEGGEIRFFMSAIPGKRFGKSLNERPRSFINKGDIGKLPSIVHTPYFTDNVTSFYPSKKISLENINPTASVFYSMSTEANTERKYTEPFEINTSSKITAYSEITGSGKSDTVTRVFYKAIFRGMEVSDTTLLPTLKTVHNWSSYYPASGIFSLIDGIRGSRSFRDGLWQAYSRKDMDVTIDMKQKYKIDKIIIGLYHDPGAWIFFPQYLQVFGSVDGISFTEIGKEVPEIPARNYKTRLHDFTFKCNTEFRYIRIFAKNHPQLPDWHVTKGEHTFIFADEIIILPEE